MNYKAKTNYELIIKNLCKRKEKNQYKKINNFYKKINIKIISQHLKFKTNDHNTCIY